MLTLALLSSCACQDGLHVFLPSILDPHAHLDLSERLLGHDLKQLHQKPCVQSIAAFKFACVADTAPGL